MRKTREGTPGNSPRAAGEGSSTRRNGPETSKDRSAALRNTSKTTDDSGEALCNGPGTAGKGGRPPEGPESTRRSFLTKIWIGAGILAAIETAGVVVTFLRPSARARKKEADTGTILEAGPVEKFAPGSVTAFVSGKFYLCRLGDGGFLALSRKCTHLGCTVPWLAEEKRFACPCHSSAFDIRGEVLNPPAARPLDRYRVSIENNIVKVDTGGTIRRSGFRPEDVVYAGKV